MIFGVKSQMFTGIVTDLGEILELEQKGDLRARIKTNYDTAGITFGASIACDGTVSYTHLTLPTTEAV